MKIFMLITFATVVANAATLTPTQQAALDKRKQYLAAYLDIRIRYAQTFITELQTAKTCGQAATTGAIASACDQTLHNTEVSQHTAELAEIQKLKTDMKE